MIFHLAEKLCKHLGYKRRIKELGDCDHEFFVQMYEHMLSEKLPGLISNANEMEEQIHNVQVVIDQLATEILETDLSHIEAQSIVQRNPIHIQHLLEIFDGLLELVLEETDDEQQCSLNQDLDDSNVIADDHEVLSDVFQEEFGGATSSKYIADQGVAEKPLSPDKRAFVTEKYVHRNGKMFLMDSTREGNSTNELIHEAELIEKRRREGRSNTTTTNDEKAGNDSEVNNWSDILVQTNSAVDSFADAQEIGKRPRRQLDVEKKQHEEESKENQGGGSVIQHKHTHHHYHHKFNSNSSSTADVSSATSKSPSSTSSSNDSTKSSNKINTEDKNYNKTLHDDKGQPTTSSSSSSFKFDYEKKNKKVGRDTNYVDSWVQTDVGADTTLPSHKEFLKSLHDSSMTDSTLTRSRQLSELNSRLQNLRQELRPSRSTNETMTQTTPSHAYGDKENGKSRKTKDHHTKVSFASDVYSRRPLIPSCSSDTEIDYSSPMRVKITKRKTRPTTTNTSKKDNQFERLARHCFSSTKPVSKSQAIPKKKDVHWLHSDQRLRELQLENECNRLNEERQLKNLRQDYSQQRNLLVQRKATVEKEKQSNLSKKRYETRSKSKKGLQRKMTPDKDYALRLANIYKTNNHNVPSRGRSEITKKCRKRSASSSPVGRRRLKSRLVLYEDEILPVMQEEFPFLQLSPHTAKLMWQKQMRQVNTLCKSARLNRPSKAQQQIEDAQKKQEMLARIIQKEISHNQRMKDYKDQKFQEGLVKKKLAERRQRSACARKYYNEYAVRNKSRMLNKKSKEEKIFKQLFEDGLEIQRERLRELKKYAHEQREKNDTKQRNEIESMENYYRGQFSLLADTIAQEKSEIQIRQKAQNQLLHKMRNDMRKKMEGDIQTIQEQLINEQDTLSFRQIDADNMRKEFKLATYKSTRF
ncbi:centrosomal protein of 95 kDa-like isoform X2 [Clytia hemisphaerica]